jgi:Ca2+-transporting ATPase
MLGSATVLCTDKTGTLTENRMAVAELWAPGGDRAGGAVDGRFPTRFRPLLETALLASPEAPSDPMDMALVAAARGDGIDKASADHILLRAHGLTPELLATTNVWRSRRDGTLLVATKGAPEAVSALCRLSPQAHHELLAAVAAMASRGMRVLGLAMARPAAAAADDPHSYPFSLVGLVGLADPLRANVATAVAECRRAGIRVVMVTGDHAATARAIADQAGLGDGEVLTGTELAALTEAQLADRLDRVVIFARILPQQKLRIVEAFQARGEIVAMTGDGVNDASSLRAADIGVAMGGRGTDVAREAAAIVLLDDDFGSIVGAVRQGRRIYDNIRKATGFIFAVHVPIAGLAILPFVLGLPVLFGPIHIALIEMIIDPVCALSFEAEPEEPDIMAVPPRPAGERLFSWRSVAANMVQGGLALVMPAAAYVLAAAGGVGEAETRAITFFALVAAILVLILASRSFGHSVRKAFRPNAILRYVLIGVAAFTLAVLLVPPLQTVLKFAPIHLADAMLITAGAAFLLLVLELAKSAAARLSAAG